VALEKPLRDLGLKSERLLMPTRASKFEDEVADLEQRVGLTTLAKAVAWAQTNSMWPDTFGLACCAIEMMSIVGSRYDIARFGMEPFRGSPRQADLLIVSGRVSHKMAAPLRQIYDQMLEPKWVIAMGACASSGGMFNNYAIVQGVDHIVPVDIYLPGCPPRPEMLLDAIVKLHDKIQNMKLGANREKQITELEQARLRRLPLLPHLQAAASQAEVDR
jgi:NADH-quinone oxidoreductase subunit B